MSKNGLQQLDLFEKVEKKEKKLTPTQNKYLGQEWDPVFENERWQSYYRYKYNDYEEYYRSYRNEIVKCKCGVVIEITFYHMPQEPNFYRIGDNVPTNINLNNNLSHYYCPNCRALYYRRDVKIVRVDVKLIR